MRSPSPTSIAPTVRTLAASLFLLTAALSAGASDFVAPRSFAAGTGANFGAVTADFNHDGKLDTAVFAYTGSGENVNVIMGNGNGTFQAPVSYAVGGNPQQMLSADFNHDGYPDIAVSTESGEQILINNGDGTFQSAVTYHAFGVGAVADFNGDGNLDIAVTEYDDGASNYVDVMLGNGDGTFQTVKKYKGGPCAYQAAAGDLNHDGKIDLILANGGCGSGPQQNQFTVLLGNGDGSFQAPVAYSDTASPYQVAVGDFNRDGNLDIAAVVNLGSGGLNNGEVDVYFGNGDGTFTKGRTFPTASYFGGVIVADFNNDGLLDIATADGGNVSILLGDGDGTFRPTTYYQPAAGFGYMAAGDFKNNGMTDIVTVGNSQISLLLDQPGGTFHAAQNYQGTPYSDNAVLADFNGDGLNDMVSAGTVVKGQNSNTAVTVLLNSGQQGRFKAQPVLTPITSEVNQPIFVAAGDFNGDHKTDVAVSLRNLNGNAYVTILFGNGDGTFTAGASYQVSSGYSGESILAIDLNNDGILDLVVGCGYNICVLLGHGDGTFGAPQSYSGTGNVYESVSGLAIGDVNHDGKLDIVASCLGIIQILLGNGDGTFQPPTSYSSSHSKTTYGVALADFNGDGNLDIAVANNVTGGNGSTVGVLLGNGDGTFQAQKNYGTGSSPSSNGFNIAVADFDGDGKLDIAIPISSQLCVLHGKGDGSLGPPTTYGGEGISIAVGVVTSKPGPDLIVTGAVTTVYLNSRDQQ
jgi:hypothetical protein